MTPAEIAHFAELISSLIVSAARTDDPAKLSEIRAELVDAIDGALTLLAHDAGASIPLVRDLLAGAHG